MNSVIIGPGRGMMIIGPSSLRASIRLKSSTRQTKSPGKSTDNRSAQTKGYLKKGQGSSSGATDGKTDRFEVIRQTLYEVDPQTEESLRLNRLEELIPHHHIHETIHRAWQLRLRHKRIQQNERLERQYRAMNDALEALRIQDRKLYLKTIKDEHGGIDRLQNIVQPASIVNSTGKLAGLFPRQMKVPTELPAMDGKRWDTDWKNPMEPLVP